MAIDILFTGLLLFTFDESGANAHFVEMRGHIPRLEIVTKSGNKMIPIEKADTVTLRGMGPGKPGTRNSFEVLVPSITSLASKVKLGKVSPEKLKKLKTIRLTGGSLSAGEGTEWCEFKNGTASAGYGSLASVVTWKGTLEGILINGSQLDLKDAIEVVIHNDMPDKSMAMNHFGAYSAVLEGSVAMEDFPVPCPDVSKGLKAKMEALRESVEATTMSRTRKDATLQLMYRGNPLLCPPAQQ